MKKLLSLTLMSLIIFGGYASARNIYDSTGRHLIYDNTLRGRKRALKAEQQNKIQAAAAAKIDYNQNIEEVELKSNYIQSASSLKRELPKSNLKSNYIQSKNLDY